MRRTGRGYVGGRPILADAATDTTQQLRPRQPAPSGVCRAAGGGSERRYYAPAGSRSRTKENAPSRSRLRPVHPIDLRRSDCRAGEPSTFGAPCSVHSETYRRMWPASSTYWRQCVANCDNRVCDRICRRIPVHAEAHRGRGLLRPATRPTAAEATACRRAINLRRSVLGAHGTLRPSDRAVKWEPIPKIRILRSFSFRQHELAFERACSRKNRTMSSPSRVRFRPPPRLTFRFRVRPPGRASS